jgi:pimeloyl-ACP methyl ester carboxylesterase
MVGAPGQTPADLFFAHVATDPYVNTICNGAQSPDGSSAARQATPKRAALEKIGPDQHAGTSSWSATWRGCSNEPANAALDRKLLLLLASPIYTLRDIYNWFNGFEFAKAQLFEQIMAYDGRRLGARFEIPFFLFQGDSDVITLTTLAEEYFNEVEAPIKKLTLIKNAGHFAAFSQPDQFLNELITQVHPLAAVLASDSKKDKLVLQLSNP